MLSNSSLALLVLSSLLASILSTWYRYHKQALVRIDIRPSDPALTATRQGRPLRLPVNVAHKPAILLFDGVCNVCNYFVNFIMDRDPECRIVVLALQSEEAKAILKSHKIEPDSIDASVLIEDNQCFIGSTAVLHVLLLLDGYWSFLGAVGLAVPELLRELVYGVFAKVRYQVFGKHAASSAGADGDAQAAEGVSCRRITAAVRAHLFEFSPFVSEYVPKEAAAPAAAAAAAASSSSSTSNAASSTSSATSTAPQAPAPAPAPALAAVSAPAVVASTTPVAPEPEEASGNGSSSSSSSSQPRLAETEEALESERMEVATPPAELRWRPPAAKANAAATAETAAETAGEVTAVTTTSS